MSDNRRLVGLLVLCLVVVAWGLNARAKELVIKVEDMEREIKAEWTVVFDQRRVTFEAESSDETDERIAIIGKGSVLETGAVEFSYEIRGRKYKRGGAVKQEWVVTRDWFIANDGDAIDRFLDPLCVPGYELNWKYQDSPEGVMHILVEEDGSQEVQPLFNFVPDGVKIVEPEDCTESSLRVSATWDAAGAIKEELDLGGPVG